MKAEDYPFVKELIIAISKLKDAIESFAEVYESEPDIFTAPISIE